MNEYWGAGSADLMGRSALGVDSKRQWLLWTLAAVCLAWLLVALVSNWPAAPAALAGAVALLGNASAVFLPLVVLLLIAAFVPFGPRDPNIDFMEERVATAMQSAGQLEEQLARIDATLASCADKVQAMSTAAAREGSGLGATAEALEVAAGTMALASGDMGRAAAALADSLPAMTAQARDAESLLRTAGGQATLQIQAVDGALAAIAARSTDAGIQAETSIAAMQKLLAQIDATSSETTKAIANRAYTLDAAVTGVLDRSAAAFASIGETLQDYSGRFETMIAGARTDIDNFGADGTRAIGQRLDVLLGAANQLKQHFAEHQQLSDQVQERASASIGAIEARLLDVRTGQEQATDEMQARIAQGVGELETRLEELRARQHAAADAVHERAAASVAVIEARMAEVHALQAEAAREVQERGLANADAIEARLAALRTRQAEISSELEEQNAAAMASIEDRLELLRGNQKLVADDLGIQASAGIADVEARLAGLHDRQDMLRQQFEQQLAEGVASVEARLAEMREMAEARLGDTSVRVAQTLAEVDALGGALAARQDATETLLHHVGDLRPMLAEFADEAESRMPRLNAAFDGVSDRSEGMLSQLEDLRNRIESQAAVLRDTAAAFERDHAALADLSEALSGHFHDARAIVGEIHSSTEQTALAAASRMVENVLQVRQSVNATSVEIRNLLGEVVADAERSLDEFASTKAEATFGAPIRLQIAALEDAALRAADAASGASERVSGRLLELLRTISETEARIDEVDTRMDVRVRDTLAARSLRLIDSLNNASVDVARLLAVDVGETAWDRYLKGDRSLFARATVRLADKDTARKIARHFEHDEPFRDEAARYCDQFELLIRRVLKDPDGESFALILLSSDIGKLYVLIAQAIGRTIARNEN